MTATELTSREEPLLNIFIFSFFARSIIIGPFVLSLFQYWRTVFSSEAPVKGHDCITQNKLRNTPAGGASTICGLLVVIFVTLQPVSSIQEGGQKRARVQDLLSSGRPEAGVGPRSIIERRGYSGQGWVRDGTRNLFMDRTLLQRFKGGSLKHRSIGAEPASVTGTIPRFFRMIPT